ncbi:hypothetical protein LKK83_05785 [Phormidium sp. CCY1219]|nr:hypothetical protein [Phormidium sp. CCY1219]
MPAGATPARKGDRCLTAIAFLPGWFPVQSCNLPLTPLNSPPPAIDSTTILMGLILNSFAAFLYFMI